MNKKVLVVLLLLGNFSLIKAMGNESTSNGQAGLGLPRVINEQPVNDKNIVRYVFDEASNMLDCNVFTALFTGGSSVLAARYIVNEDPTDTCALATIGCSVPVLVWSMRNIYNILNDKDKRD